MHSAQSPFPLSEHENESEVFEAQMGISSEQCLLFIWKAGANPD